MKNLTISQQIAIMRAETKQACADIVHYCSKIVGAIRKAVRSCLWARTIPNVVNEPTDGAPQGVRTVLPDWSEYPDANYQYRCNRMRENIDREVAEEQLFSEALQILNK